MDSDEEFFGGPTAVKKTVVVTKADVNHQNAAGGSETADDSDGSSATTDGDESVQDAGEEGANKKRDTGSESSDPDDSQEDTGSQSSDDEESGSSHPRGQKITNQSDTDRSGGSERVRSGRDSSPSDSGKTDSDKTDSEPEQVKSEEDPLSDIWDSADNEDAEKQKVGAESDAEKRTAGAESDAENQDMKVPNVAHELVTVKTMAGPYKLDLTSPEVLLEEAVHLRQEAYRRKDGDACVKQSFRMLALTRIVYGDGAVWRLAECHARIAQAYWELFEFPEQTKYYAENAKSCLQFADLTDPVVSPTGELIPFPTKGELLDTTVLTYYLLGKAFLAKRLLSEAENALQKAKRALDGRKQISGKNTQRIEKGAKNRIGFWTAEIETAMARVKLCQKKTDEALKHLEKVRKLMEKRYGAEHEKMIIIHQEIAHALCGVDLDDSAQSYLKAYEIAKTVYKPGDERLADAATQLASAYSKIKTEDGAVYGESYFQEAAKCYKAVDTNHPKLLKVQELLAAHYADRTQYSNAIETLETCLKHSTEQSHEFRNQARLQKQLANYLLADGKVGRARAELRKVAELETKLYGPNDKKVVATRMTLSVLSKGEDRQQASKPNFKSVVRMMAPVGRTGLKHNVFE